MTIAALMLLFVTAASAVAGACPEGCAPGGGKAASDCLVEYGGLPGLERGRALDCEDGDPACDSDGIANGSCRFPITVCLGVTDPRLPRCTAENVAAFRLRRGGAGGDDRLATLEAAVRSTLPRGAGACTSAV